MISGSDMKFICEKCAASEGLKCGDNDERCREFLGMCDSCNLTSNLKEIKEYVPNIQILNEDSECKTFNSYDL